jgi:purine nucleosidase
VSKAINRGRVPGFFFAALRLLSIVTACSPMLFAPALVLGAPAENVIIDTDVGTDIDDAFAVALALRSPELNVLGFTTASGDTAVRARIIDRMLGESNREDIPVAVGAPTTLPYGIPGIGRQSRYGENGRFARPSHPSAVDFILGQIQRLPGQITLVTIGPLTNVGALIDKDAASFRKLKRVVMMGGSIGVADFGGLGTSAEPIPEYNILGDIPAAQKLFESGVPIYVMPLDSTASLKLDEVKRDIIFSQATPLTDSLTLLYHLWGSETPVLFDSMTLAFIIDPKLCPVEPMRIRVDDKGITRKESGPTNAQVCLHSDPDTFFQFHVRRLTLSQR